ncbi:MAG: cyclodeaminase/cyclohydrolase family protein [Planctomycetes bacterium]|nr:cyclodeaminase/cyclohydrolase family protein [Planctomycetota bacterium]
MTTNPTVSLVGLSLTTFSDALAARTQTPGGGSLAAYMVACAAATVSMAARFTSGDKYIAVAQSMGAHAADLDLLRERALALVDRDSAAYDRVTAAFKLPKATDDEKAARSAAIQAATKGALEVPLEVMAVALAVLRHAGAAAGSINPNLASDCGSGAHAALAGLESALANVAINAASLKDAEYIAVRKAEAESMRREARACAEAVRAALAPHIGG